MPLWDIYALFLRTAHPVNFTLNAKHCWVLSNTPAGFHLHAVEDSRDNRKGNRIIIISEITIIIDGIIVTITIANILVFILIIVIITRQIKENSEL